MAFFTNCLTLRGIKGSALTHAELDNNFICLDTGLSNLSNVVNSLSGITGNAISGLTYDNGVLTLTEMDGNTFSVTIASGGQSYSNILVSATTADNYSATSVPVITGYSPSYVYITTFNQSNISSGVTININGLGNLDITKVGEAGLVPLEEGDIISGVTYYLIYNGDNMQLLTSEPVDNTNSYTTFMGPTTVAVGGTPIGSTFSAATMQQVFDSIFYTYQNSAFSSFYIQQLGVTQPVYEVGRTITGGNYTFIWNTTYPANVQTNSIKIYNNINTIISTPSSGMSNDYTEIITLPTITNNSATSYTWKIGGTRTNNTGMTLRNYSATWRFRRYWGNSATAVPTSGMVTTLGYSDLNGGNVNGIFQFSASSGTYKHICYPSTAPSASLFRDNLTLLNMAMADPTDGYTGTTTNGNWYYKNVSVPNQYGIVNNYKCFRSKYQLGGDIDINVT